jgi:hypothetical protein
MHDIRYRKRLTTLSITPAIFTGAIPCFAIAVLTLLEATVATIFHKSVHFGSFSSIISGVSIYITIKQLFRQLYNFFGFISGEIEFNGFF